MKKLLFLISIQVILLSCQNIKSDNKENLVSLKPNDILNIKNDIKAQMDSLKLKGLSVVVYDNYKTVWLNTWGIRDTILNQRIDSNTSFSAASIAKPISALVFAIMEEKGLIDMSYPISKYLKRWNLPDSKFSNDITLEHLLSHTSGSTQGGFTDFYQGDSIPTIVNSLKGEIPGYDNEIEFVFAPGSNWRYSGGGYVIAQMAVEDHTGKKLADLANTHLFNPLGLKYTTMKQPNEPNFTLSNIAKAHDKHGDIIRTGVPITPQVSASGLWTTPSEIAKILIEIQNALDNKSTKVISHNVAKRITEIKTIKFLGGWSLGWQRYEGFGNYDWFSHDGANTGIGGHIYASMDGGKGFVAFGNGPNSIRKPIIESLRKQIFKSCNWNKPLDISKQKSASKNFVNDVIGSYRHVLFDVKSEVVYENEKFFIKPFITGSKAELIYLGNHTFITNNFPNKLILEKNNQDGNIYLAFKRDGVEEKEYIMLKE